MRIHETPGPSAIATRQQSPAECLAAVCQLGRSGRYLLMDKLDPKRVPALLMSWIKLHPNMTDVH